MDEGRAYFLRVEVVAWVAEVGEQVNESRFTTEVSAMRLAPSTTGRWWLFAGWERERLMVKRWIAFGRMQ